jgi:hypothetical protein
MDKSRVRRVNLNLEAQWRLLIAHAVLSHFPRVRNRPVIFSTTADKRAAIEGVISSQAFELEQERYKGSGIDLGDFVLILPTRDPNFVWSR